MYNDIPVDVPDIFRELKSIPVFKNAVVAGGYLRDQVYKTTPDDLDIFVPTRSSNTFYEELDKSWGAIQNLGLTVDKMHFPETDNRIKKDASKYGNKQNLVLQYDFKYKDMSIDIMGMRLNVDGFVANLIEEFPFANQQIAHDGKKLITSKDFDQDIKYNTMTLRFINSVYELPKLMQKYNKVRDKYPKIVFETDYMLQKRDGDDWL